MGIDISAGQISHMLTEGHEEFHREKEAVLSAWADPTKDVVWDVEDEVLVAEAQRHLEQLDESSATNGALAAQK